MKNIFFLVLFLLCISCVQEENTTTISTTDTIWKHDIYSAEPTMGAIYLPFVQTPQPVRGWAKAYSGLTNTEMDILGIEWYYDYTLKYDAPNQNGAQYVPFLWCDIYPSLRYDDPLISYFDELHKLPDGYNDYVLFLNEPDLRGSTVDGGQCERTPRQAAYMLKAARGICPACMFVGPVVSHGDYRAGDWEWLNAFYAEITRLQIKPPEVSAIHTYLSENPELIVDSHFAVLKKYPNTAKTAWVTEYSSANVTIAERMTRYYLDDPRITRYAWFTAKNLNKYTDLVDPSGNITEMGAMYSNTN